MDEETLREMDRWCNFGFRFMEKMDPKSPEYVTALYALRDLMRRRVAHLKFGPVFVPGRSDR